MRWSARMIPVLTLVLASHAYAQQGATVDAEGGQGAEAVVAQYVDALNQGDGEALAALYASNPIDVTPFGKNTSLAQIQDAAKILHSRGLVLSAQADSVAPLIGGQTVLVTAHYTGTYSKDPATTRKVQGNLVFVVERDGGAWKIRVSSASRLAMP